MGKSIYIILIIAVLSGFGEIFFYEQTHFVGAILGVLFFIWLCYAGWKADRPFKVKRQDREG